VKTLGWIALAALLAGAAPAAAAPGKRTAAAKRTVAVKRKAPAKRAAPVKRDWLAAAVATPRGSYVVGNPAARVKLVEYLSYTCSHCAAFSGEGWPGLKRDYLARGRASIEVRHAIRDQMDLAAALIARCDGPSRFLAHSEAIFAAQGDWMTKGIFFETQNAERLAKMKPTPALIETAAGTGLEALARSRGMAPAKIRACLSNEVQQKLLSAQAKEAWATRKIPGTPAFLLNGKLVPDASSWAALKPPLDTALK